MGKVNIHPTAIIEEGAKLADDVCVGPYCCVGPQVSLDSGVNLDAHIVIAGRTTIGANTKVSAFTKLGGAPQHLGYKDEDTALVIGKNNIIRENVTMHLGTVEGRGETRIGDNGFFMAGTHVAHDCIVKNHAIFANNACIAGHVVLQDHVFLGGLSAVHQFSHIGAHAFIGAGAVVIHDIIPYGSANGNYADLVGLNLIGLRRRGFSKEIINELRAAYRILFAKEPPFEERVKEVSDKFGEHKDVMNIIEFINSDRPRHIMMPKQ